LGFDNIQLIDKCLDGLKFSIVRSKAYEMGLRAIFKTDPVVATINTNVATV
jgi:hypothetical protein